MKAFLGVAVIGLGRAGSRHARALVEGQVPGARLVGVCDIARERMGNVPGTVLATTDTSDILTQREADVVVVATPHRSHLELARAALAAGKHVLVEKPLGLHKAECERALSSHAGLGPTRPLFGVVHDYRADPRFQWLRGVLTSGELGRVERVVWQATDWFRTDAYYDASSWRGSFASEGGGVLVNQAPHLLDTMVWLFGAPRRVVGLCRFGRFHEVDVEDDVTAHLEFAAGFTALLIASTGEAPGSDRLEISADRGRIVIEGGSALVHRNHEPSSVYRRREPGGRPLADVERVDLPAPGHTGALLLENFVAAVRGDAALLAPAEEAARAVEVANAILWSSLTERPVDLPIDGAAFARVHEELSRKSRQRVGSG